MNLNADTIDALGMGDHWEQLAIRWPLFILSRGAGPRRAEKAAGMRASRALQPRAEYLAAVRLPSDEARREAQRVSKREHMRRVRARSRAA